MIPTKTMTVKLSLRRAIFNWLFKHKVPGTWELWNLFSTKIEREEVYRQMLPAVRTFEAGAPLLQQYREKSNLYAYWFSDEKLNLLPNQMLGGVRGVINFDGLFGNYELRTKIFTTLVVDDETFKTFFTFLIRIEGLAREWGYRSFRTEKCILFIEIGLDEESQFNQRFMKELATAMSRTKAFSNQFDKLYEYFQLI